MLLEQESEGGGQVTFRFLCSPDFGIPPPAFRSMGKGDKRTKKGKIYRGSYGKRRPRKLKTAKPAPKKRG